MENSYLNLIDTNKIWEVIEDLYLIEPDPIKIMKQTGIPATLIRETVQVELTKRLKGGEIVCNIATLEDPKITRKEAIDIIYICRNEDGTSVNIKKAKKFLSFFKKQDSTLRRELIKAGKRNHGSDVKDWITIAEIEINKSKKRTKSLGAIQAEIRKNIPDHQERVEFLNELIEEIDLNE